jgi:hypothetical protein
MTEETTSMPEDHVTVVVCGARTRHGKRRPDYVRNAETTRDPPSKSELAVMRGRPGAKLWRKARESKS